MTTTNQSEESQLAEQLRSLDVNEVTDDESALSSLNKDILTTLGGRADVSSIRAREMIALLPLPEPQRCSRWVRMAMFNSPGHILGTAEVRLAYLYDFTRAKSRPQATNIVSVPFLPNEQFVDCVVRAIDGVEAIELEGEGGVVRSGLANIAFRRTPLERRSSWEERDKRQVGKMIKEGKIDPPASLFAQKLRESPLLPQ